MPVDVPEFSNGDRSRWRWYKILVGGFAGSVAIGLIAVWISAVLFFIPRTLATGVGLLATFVVVGAPAATIRCDRG